MTLTVTPEAVLLLIVVGLLLIICRWVNSLKELVSEIDKRYSTAICRYAEEAKTRDEILLKITQANNTFLARMAGAGGNDITRKLRQQQAMLDAQEAAALNGLPMTDVMEALQAEMDSDGPDN